jgi:hypothetical protein
VRRGAARGDESGRLKTRAQVGRWERAIRDDLRRRRWLRWHCTLIALCTFLAAWTTSYALKQTGVDALAVRYGLAFLVAYGLLALLTNAWARWLLSRDEADAQIDIPSGGANKSAGGGRSGCEPQFESGGGGDFGGGGAGDVWGEGLGSAAETAIEGTGKTLSATVEVAAAADEFAIVLIPVAAVIAIAMGAATFFGMAVFGLFGVEVLLAVAVEIAIASSGAALIYKAGREGWLLEFVRKTFWSAVLALLLLVSLGWAIDRWLPQAESLPHAIRLLQL